MQELVYLKNDEAVCDSLQVAEKFHKRHDNVMQTISNLLKNEEIKSRNLFRISHYMDSKGRTYRIHGYRVCKRFYGSRKQKSRILWHGKFKIARVFSQLSSIYGLSRPSASM